MAASNENKHNDFFSIGWAGNNNFKPMKYELGENIIYFEDLRTPTKSKFRELEVINSEKVFKSTLSNYVNNEEIEDGIISKSEIYLESQLKIHGIYVKEWLSELYAENYANYNYLINLVKLISRFNFDSLYPINVTIVLSSLANANIEVSEAALSILENWGDQEALKYLENTKMNEQWLENYRLKIIEDIKVQLAN